MGYEVEWRPDEKNVYLRGGKDNLALHHGTPRAPVDESGQLDHVLVVVAPVAGLEDLQARGAVGASARHGRPAAIARHH